MADITQRPGAPKMSRFAEEVEPANAAAVEAQRPGRSRAAHSFKFLAANQLPVKPIAWLVKDYLESDTLAVMYGPPSAGKSFLALDISCCIAAGLSFHGHDVKPGAVFYIVGEGHGGVARRIHAWAEHNSSAVPGSLFISETPADFFDCDSSARVASAVDSIAIATGVQPALIVIDTMARNFLGEENSATDVNRFVRNLDDIRRRWQATVLIVHHSGKDHERGARGSIALKCGVDAEYEVTCNAKDGMVRLTPGKMKDAVKPTPLAFELESVLVKDTFGHPVQSAVLRPVAYTATSNSPQPQGKNQQRALQVLKDMYSEASEKGEAPDITLDDWKKRLAERGVNRNRAKEACDSLARRGIVSVDEGHVELCAE
jgi:KaiC/GvpD/RAD55 family RecA-like ATPase